MLLLEARKLVDDGLRHNTQKTYSSAQKQFQKFCLKFSLAPVPASEDTLLMYISHLNNKGLKGSTISVYIAAVRSLHIQEGLPDPLVGCLRVKRALKAVNSSSGPPSQKLPVTCEILKRIQSVMLNIYDHKMLWAAYTVAYFGLLRAAEFTVTGKFFDKEVNLQVKDVEIIRDEVTLPYISVHIKRCKTDRKNKGTTIYIGCSKTSVCAVCAMIGFLDVRKAVSITEPLFLFRDGSALTRTSLVDNMKHFLHICGMSAECYSGHSFRSGGATDAALSGMADWEVKLAGRWSSDAYQRYVRAPRSTLLGFASRMIGHTADTHAK